MLHRALVVSLLLIPSWLLAADPLDLVAADRLVGSPSGGAVAIASSDGEAEAPLTVSVHGSGAKKLFTYGWDDLDALLPDGALGELAWSPDSRYLAIELVTASGESALGLLDIEGRGTLRPVSIDGHDQLALPRWSPAGHELWAVHSDVSEDSSEGDVGGVFRWNIHTGDTSRYLDELWITDFMVRNGALLALGSIESGDGDSLTIRLVRLDLKAGKKETILQQREAQPSTGRRKTLVL